MLMAVWFSSLFLFLYTRVEAGCFISLLVKVLLMAGFTSSAVSLRVATAAASISVGLSEEEAGSEVSDKVSTAAASMSVGSVAISPDVMDVGDSGIPEASSSSINGESGSRSSKLEEDTDDGVQQEDDIEPMLVAFLDSRLSAGRG